MKTIRLILCVFLVCVFCTSCAHLPFFGKNNKPIEQLRENLTVAEQGVGTASEDLSKTSTGIRQSAQGINDNAQKIGEKIPKDSAQDVRDRLTSIKSDASSIVEKTDTLDDIALRLQKVKKNIGDAKSNTEDAVKSSEEMQKEINDLKSEKQAALQKVMNSLIVIAILLIAISAIGVFQGNYKAIGGIIGGVMIIVISLAVSVLYVNLAWVGLIGIIGVVLIVAFGIYQGLHTKREKIKNEKALEETVLTVEALKKKLPEDVKKEFFGDEAYPGVTKNLQSKETEEKILNIRRKLNDSIKPTISGNN